MPRGPKLSQPILLQPAFQIGSVRSLHGSPTFVFFADHDRFGTFGQGIYQQVGQFRYEIRMHADLRFLYAHQSGRIRIQQDSQQTKLAQAPVGKTDGRNGQFALRKEHLDRPPSKLSSKSVTPS